jgi:hypothetical protein
VRSGSGTRSRALTVDLPTDQPLTPTSPGENSRLMEWLMTGETAATLIAAAGAIVFSVAWWC